MDTALTGDVEAVSAAKTTPPPSPKRRVLRSHKRTSQEGSSHNFGRIDIDEHDTDIPNGHRAVTPSDGERTPHPHSSVPDDGGASMPMGTSSLKRPRNHGSTPPSSRTRSRTGALPATPPSPSTMSTPPDHRRVFSDYDTTIDVNLPAAKRVNSGHGAKDGGDSKSADVGLQSPSSLTTRHAVKQATAKNGTASSSASSTKSTKSNASPPPSVRAVPVTPSRRSSTSRKNQPPSRKSSTSAASGESLTSKQKSQFKAVSLRSGSRSIAKKSTQKKPLKERRADEIEIEELQSLVEDEWTPHITLDETVVLLHKHHMYRTLESLARNTLIQPRYISESFEPKEVFKRLGQIGGTEIAEVWREEIDDKFDMKLNDIGVSQS